MKDLLIFVPPLSQLSFQLFQTVMSGIDEQNLGVAGGLLRHVSWIPVQERKNVNYSVYIDIGQIKN